MSGFYRKAFSTAAAVLIMSAAGVTAFAVDSPWSAGSDGKTEQTVSGTEKGSSDEVHLSRASVEMKTGERISIRLTGAKGTVKWRISDPKVFTYSKGYITANGEGSAVLTAEYNGKKYRCTVTVEKKLTGLSADTYDLHLKKGEKGVVRINTAGKSVMAMAGNGALCSMECSPIIENEFDLTVTALKNGSCDITVFNVDNKKDKFIIKLTVSNGSIGASMGGKSSDTETAAVDEADFADEVIRLCNEERESRGLSPLEKSDSLTRSAAVRVGELPENFSHTRPDGTSCFTAVTENFSASGENIAMGYTTPEEAVTGWMNSPGHKSNILDPDFTKIGVGYYSDGYYWVQVFAG